MPRIESLNVLLESEGNDYLAELYGKVINNVQKNLVSVHMKNRDLSGTPEAGSVEAKRFVNATANEYGTARKAAKGDSVKARPVTIPIDTDKEIVEELEEKDVALYGVDGLLDRRANNHAQRMLSNLDTDFFAAAVADGTAVTLTSTEVQDQAEELIQSVETTQNDFVDGVPRDMIHLVCEPSTYGKLRNYIDTIQTASLTHETEEIRVFHGVKIYSSVHLKGAKMVCMADGAIAQPVRAKVYSAEKIPLSNAYGVELFYSYGTKTVMPDLINYVAAE